MCIHRDVWTFLAGLLPYAQVRVHRQEVPRRRVGPGHIILDGVRRHHRRHARGQHRQARMLLVTVSLPETLGDTAISLVAHWASLQSWQRRATCDAV